MGPLLDIISTPFLICIVKNRKKLNEFFILLMVNLLRHVLCFDHSRSAILPWIQTGDPAVLLVSSGRWMLIGLNRLQSTATVQNPPEQCRPPETTLAVCRGRESLPFLGAGNVPHPFGRHCRTDATERWEENLLASAAPFANP